MRQCDAKHFAKRMASEVSEKVEQLNLGDESDDEEVQQDSNAGKNAAKNKKKKAKAKAKKAEKGTEPRAKHMMDFILYLILCVDHGHSSLNQTFHFSSSCWHSSSVSRCCRRGSGQGARTQHHEVVQHPAEGRSDLESRGWSPCCSQGKHSLCCLCFDGVCKLND